MDYRFADRMNGVHKSFIREILKVTEQPEIISFAGGLPNPALFPVADFARAAEKVLDAEGSGPASLQYATSEGLPPLRRWIADRYAAKRGLDVDPDTIIITTGSQQALDLLAKVFLNPGDPVVVERPGYLGALQSFSFYQPRFVSVTLLDDGPDLEELERVFQENAPKLFYAVTTFQNPSGLSYSAAKREAVAALCARYGVLCVEDDPYGELRFSGQSAPPVRAFEKTHTVLLGSFSKITAPGVRLGWVTAAPEIMDKLVTAKQAADLHSSTLAQHVMYRYLADNDTDAHVAKIIERYGSQCRAMIEACETHFPAEASITRPEGGMFLWATLPDSFGPEQMNRCFQRALERKVAFVPGTPFFADGGGSNTMRLNFSNANEERIREGVSRLGEVIAEVLSAD